MSKERLEEIKKLRETILEENDFRTRCVLASVFVGLGYMDYLIKQAERVQELEEELYGNNIQMGYKQMYSECNRDYAKLRHQNKRYREAIKKGINATRYTNPEVAYILAEALEGRE